MGCSSTPTKDGSASTDDSSFPKRPVGAPELTPQQRAKQVELRRTMHLKAPKLYANAHKKLLGGSYADAIREFDHLISQYPFSRYATQSRLEKIYAEYRSYKYDQALAEASQFLREHPRYPNADYALYLEALVNAERVQSFTKHLGIDQSGHDTTHLRAGFQELALLERLYPKSIYRADARKRMIYLRNRIAKHDLGIARFYISRGAWVAAARRASDIIANYPRAPATAHALLVMKQAYAELKLPAQKKQVEALIASNHASMVAAGITSKSATDAAAQSAADALPPPVTSTPQVSSATTPPSAKAPQTTASTASTATQPVAPRS